MEWGVEEKSGSWVAASKSRRQRPDSKLNHFRDVEENFF